MSTIPASVLTSQATSSLGSFSKLQRALTTALVWSTVEPPPAALLGWVPLENIQQIQFGFSVLDVKYRSVGASFLANQAMGGLEQFNVTIRLDMLVQGVKRFFVLGALKELFEMNRKGPRSADRITGTSVEGAIGRFKRGVKIIGNGDLYYTRSQDPLTTITQSGRVSNSSMRVGTTAYMNTFPFLSESTFLPSVYIESLFWSESVEYPEAYEINILLRTWKNQWKQTSFLTNGGSDKAQEKLKYIGYLGRFLTNTGLYGIGWQSIQGIMKRYMFPFNQWRQSTRFFNTILDRTASDPRKEETSFGEFAEGSS